MLKRRDNVLTKIATLVILAFVIFSQFEQKQWAKEGAMITGDVKVYYAYLPALFIQNDIDFDDPFVYRHKDDLRILFAENEDGKKFIRNTCGMSLVYAPFFLIGHRAAYLLGEPMDGFSYPYMFFLAMGTIIYLLIGLLFLGKLLRLYFNDETVAVTLLIIFLGSNLYYYHTGTMLYSHAFSFTLIVVFLYNSIRWIELPTIKRTVVLGITSGLLVLIRPIDIVFVTALLLINVSSIRGFKERIILFWNRKIKLLLMLGIILLIMSPQFVYNYHVSGSLFFNMYANTGESFFFNDPHLMDVLISYRNGWLIYSPLMILSVIGFFYLYRMKIGIISFVLPVSLLYFFIIASWWCWWYVGFGNRAFINLYPLLAIPLAAFVSNMLKQRRIIRLLFNFIVLAGITLSMFQTRQFRQGHIHWSDMTKQAYWDVFLKDVPSELYPTYLRSAVIEDRKLGLDSLFSPILKPIYKIHVDFESHRLKKENGFEDFISSKGMNGGHCAVIPDGFMYIGDIAIDPDTNANELYVTAWFKGLEDDKTHITLSNSSNSFVKVAHEIRETKDGWSRMVAYMPLPIEIRADTLHFTIWNEGTKAFMIDNIELIGRRRSFEKINE